MKQHSCSCEPAALVKKLPLKLRICIREDILIAAIRESYILVADDGHLQWQLESKTLLAYLCGRVWCGDSSAYFKRRDAHVWKHGKRHFPEHALEELFGVQGLRNLRRQRNLLPPPEGFELIDSLFDMEESGISAV